MGHPKITPEKMEALARKIRITHRKTGKRVLWNPSFEQKTIWEDLCGARLTYFLKPRQIGATYATLLFDLIWTFVNDLEYQKVKCAIIWDTEKKLKEQFARIADMAGQLGIECDCLSTEIRFPGGSSIIGITAGATGAGRSLSFQRAHCSELPWWRRDEETWNDVQQGLGLDGSCTIETTMDLRQPLAARIWRNSNEYLKRFFRVEDCELYILPVKETEKYLSSDDESWLRSEGFTSRQHMAWWLKNRDNRCSGDNLRAFREFPQEQKHAFQASEGRWYKSTPKTANPVARPRVDGLDSTVWMVDVFVRPQDTSGQCVMALDTASGRSEDSSAIAIVDKKDRRLVATFKDKECAGDNLALVGRWLQREYTCARPDRDGLPQPDYVPLALVEVNQIGEETARQLERIGGVVEKVWMDEAKRYGDMLKARRAIDHGDTFGPDYLVEECDSLSYINGNFRGPKDLSVCIGMCMAKIAESPYQEPRVEQQNRERYKMRLGRPKSRNSRWRATR